MSQLILSQESSDPTAPGSGKWELYFKSTGLYARNNAGTVIGPFDFSTDATELTLSSDAITVTQSSHKLQPQSGTADNLSTISGTSAGQRGVLYCSDFGTDTITIKHNVGNILCIGGVDIALSNGCIFWYSNGTKVFVSGDGNTDAFSPTITSAVIGNLIFYDGSVWRNIGGLKSGELLNGKINVSVASNNLTVAIKTRAGADPSATDPVIININGTYRLLTTSLSVTKNAGTNWGNAGGTELATNEVDWFVYLIWNTTPATDILDLGFSRIPYGRVYSEFSATTTNEKYLAHANASDPTSTDDCVNIGRFAATLSATASFNWSVPTFTNVNLLQFPVYETRWLTWAPAYSCSGSLTYTSVTTLLAEYRFDWKKIEIVQSATGTLGGSASTRIGFTLPFEGEQSGIATPPIIGGGWDGNANTMCVAFLTPATPDRCDLFHYNLGNWATSGTATVRATGIYEAD